MWAIARLKPAIPVLCSLILAAHFLREQNLALVLLSMLSIPLLFFKRPWAVRAMQVFFILAALEWIHTTVVLVMERKAMGLPWVRMAIILSAVTALSLVSAKFVNRTDLNPQAPDGR